MANHQHPPDGSHPQGSQSVPPDNKPRISEELEQHFVTHHILSKARHTFSVSQIPCVKRVKTEMTLYQQYKFHRKIVTEKMGEKKLVLFFLLNNIVPFFLPKRYHAMNCRALHRMSTSKHQYWDNATLFLLYSQYFSQDFYQHLSKQLAAQNEELDLVGFVPLWLIDPFLSPHAKPSPDECQSAEEFLLEPWVLLQLPFQPSLLHQWAITLLAETLQFQLETVTLFIVGVPEVLLPEVQLLKEMLKKLMDGVFTLLSIFCDSSSVYHQENICQRLRRVREKLLRTLSEVTPIVEFILSKKCRDVICGIKRASRASKNHQNLHSTDMDVDLCSYHIWYNPNFWSQNQVPKQLITELKSFSRVTSRQLLQQEHVHSSDLIQLLKIFVISAVFYIDKLEGVSLEEIMAVVDKAPEKLMPHFVDYISIGNDIKSTDVTTHFNENTNGVAKDIFHLYSMLNFKEDKALMVRTLIQLLGSEEFGSKKVLYREELCQCQQDVKIDASLNFKYTLTQVLANREWTYEKVLEKAKDTFTAPIVDREAPSMKLGAMKVAGVFQARIQNLVFKMLKRQFETWSGTEPMLWYPECATVQYLLPCFVATFLDMHKDPSANRTQTGNCLSLVHELLLSYEQEPYEQSFTEQWKQPYLYERRKKIAEDMILARNVFLLCTDDKFHGITILPCVAKGFMNLVLHKTMTEKVGGEDELYQWTEQVFMLTSRLLKCMQTLGWYKLPLNTSLEGVWYGCKFNTHKELDEYYKKCRFKFGDNGVMKSKAQSADFEVLSKYQYLAISIYTALKATQTQQKSADLQGPPFPLDLEGQVLWAYRARDYWKLKLLLAPLLFRGNTNSDIYFVPLKVVCKNTYCLPLRNAIFIDKSLPSGPRLRVKMTHRGENTMLPVRHCRWCGFLTGKLFRECSMCREYPDYHDRNYFCSAECEEEALDKKHREEHARFFLVKLNMDRY